MGKGVVFNHLDDNNMSLRQPVPQTTRGPSA